MCSATALLSLGADTFQVQLATGTPTSPTPVVTNGPLLITASGADNINQAIIAAGSSFSPSAFSMSALLGTKTVTCTLQIGANTYTLKVSVTFIL